MGFYSNYIFPRFMNGLMGQEEFSKHRVKVLADVEGDVLEIGFGSGLNLPHYPDHVRKLIAIDVNSGMLPLAQKKIDASPIEVDNKYLSAEHLPLEDQSVDTVVCTWTLCSIPDVAGALGEFRRVLRPGGKFLFIEHGLASDPKVAKWQNRLNSVWGIIGDGCNLNRDMPRLIEAGGLKIESSENFYMPGGPKFASNTFRGLARREP